MDAEMEGSTSDGEDRPIVQQEAPARRFRRGAGVACAAALATVLWATRAPAAGRASPADTAPGDAGDITAFQNLSAELVQLSGGSWTPGMDSELVARALREHGHRPKCLAPKPSGVCLQTGDQCQFGVFADRPDCSIFTVNLAITPENLKFLNDDPRKRQYVPCDIVTNYMHADEKRFNGARCKYKGATGSFMGCYNKRSGAATPRHRACRKLSMKVDVKQAKLEGNPAVSAKDVLGVKKLQLLGMMHDDSLIRNHLGYKVLQWLDITSPCTVAVNVYINGRYDGVSDLTEQMDYTYIKHRFPAEDDGTLWKEMWFKSGSPMFYKTAKPIPDFADQELVHAGPQGGGYDLFAQFYREAKACSDSGRLCTKARATDILNRYTYPETFVKAFVGATLTANSDTPFILKHNFYLYIRGGKFHYLPWDYNQVYYDITASPIPGYAISLPWYTILSKKRRGKYCPYNVPSSKEDISQRRFHHFTCDPVGYIMGLAWKDDFKARLRAVDRNELKSKVKNEIETWDRRLAPSVTCDAQNGGWPPSVEEMRRATKPIKYYFRNVLKFWNAVATDTLEMWPSPTFADFASETTSCLVDAVQAAQYAGQAGLAIAASVGDCTHGPKGTAACSADISSVLASFSFVASFISSLLVECPIQDVTGLAQRGTGRLFFSGPKAECAAMATRLTAGLANVAGGASGLSEMCVPGVARGNRGLAPGEPNTPGRRLVSVGFVPSRDVEYARCSFDALGAALWLAEAALAIDRSTVTCSVFYENTRACGRDVSNIIEAFSYLGMFTANSVAQCAAEARFPLDKAFEATCAADIAQFVGGLASIAEGGSGMANACGKSGRPPFRVSRVRELSEEEYRNELESSKVAWQDAMNGDHRKLQQWAVRQRGSGQDPFSPPVFG